MSLDSCSTKATKQQSHFQIKRFTNDADDTSESLFCGNIKNEYIVVLEDSKVEINNKHYIYSDGAKARYSINSYGGSGIYIDKTYQSTEYIFHVDYAAQNTLPTLFDYGIEDLEGKRDVIKLKGIDPSKVYVFLKGNDLYLEVEGRGEILIQDQLANDGHQIERLECDCAEGKNDCDLVEIGYLAKQLGANLKNKIKLDVLQSINAIPGDDLGFNLLQSIGESFIEGINLFDALIEQIASFDTASSTSSGTAANITPPLQPQIVAYLAN